SRTKGLLTFVLPSGPEIKPAATKNLRFLIASDVEFVLIASKIREVSTDVRLGSFALQLEPKMRFGFADHWRFHRQANGNTFDFQRRTYFKFLMSSSLFSHVSLAERPDTPHPHSGRLRLRM